MVGSLVVFCVTYLVIASRQLFLRYGAVITAVDLVVVFGVLYAERWLGVLGWLGL